MEEIYEMLPEGIFNDFNGFSEYVNQNGIKSVYEMLPEGIFNDEQGFLDYAEKKNPIVTPSNGEKVVTESTTETETTPGSSDGLEVKEVVEVDEQVDFREQMNPMNALIGDTENLILEEEVQSFLKEDLDTLLKNSDEPLGGFYMAGQGRARAMKNANKTIDETLKLKIEADPNIQKALAVGYIKQSDIISALKGSRSAVEKLQELAVRSTEDNILKLQSEELQPYDVYSETKNYIETDEDKAIKTEAIRVVNSFNSETQKLLDANPDATAQEMEAIFQREGSPTQEQFDIAEDADYQPTGFENEQLGRMYNQIALKELSEKNEKFSIAGFNGYLKKKGFIDKYNQLLEDETISEDGRSYDYSGNYNPTLAAERLKYDYLKNYLAESDMQRIEKEVLEYKIANDGRNPFLHGDTDKINLKPSIKSEDLSQYMIKEFKTLAAVVEKQKAETKENYQRELEGGAGGDNTQWLLDSGYQGGRSVADRINSTSEWAYGWLGMDSVVDEIQMNQAEIELNRDDMLRYTYASGKSAFANGREYMIDDRGEIYDLDLKIRVSSVLEPSQIEEIRKQVSKNGVETTSFSSTGALVTTAGVASDMLLQIALTRGVGIAGQTIKGISAASKYKQGRSIIKLLEKVPMRATVASAMIAQGTLMASSLSSDVRKQALAAGMSNEEADELASSASTQGYALGVLTAPISTQRIAMDKIFGTKVKEKLIQKSIDAYTKGAGIEASKSIFKKGLDKVITNGKVYLGEGGKEFIQENIQQGGQAYVIGDNINEQAGQEIMRDTISADEFMNTSIISLTAGFFMPFAGDLKTGTVNAFKVKGRGFQAVDQMKALALMSSDSDKTKQLLDSQVKKGVYTPEQVENIMADVEIYKSTINGLPPNLSAETSLSVMSDLAKIKELEAKKKKENPAFPDFRTDVEIQKLKNRIIKKSNFDFINNKEKQKFMDNAGKELVAEKEAAGEKNYKINNSEIRNRAVENFNKLSIEEMQALASPEQEKESETKTDKQVPVTQAQKNLFGETHTDENLKTSSNPKGEANISNITSLDKEGVSTATYVNPETGSVDAIISSKDKKNFVGYVRIYENGKPTNMFSTKMESTGGAFKNMITSADTNLPDGAKVLPGKTISEGGLKSFNNSKLDVETDSDGNVVTREVDYSDATKETVKQKGDRAFGKFVTPIKSEAEAEIVKIQKAYPGIEARIVKSGLSFEIKIDLPVLIKTETDAVQKPSTEKQVLPNDATSQTDGADSEVELQQMGEGDVGTDTDTQVEEGETQTDTTSDKTAETDTEQLTEGQKYLESKRKILEDLQAKDKSLRNEDGSVPKENQKEWKENRKAIADASADLLTGDTTGKSFGAMRSYEEGSTQATTTKSDEQIKKNEAEIETVIQKVIDGKMTAEDATEYISQKFGFFVDQVNALSRYIAERSDSSFPEIGNNKSKFKDWRKGNKTTDTEQLTETTSETEVMSVNNELDNKIESFANRMADADTSNELSDEAIEFYSENQEAIDKRVSEIRKESPKDKSKTRRLATKIAKGETNFSNEQIDLYAANEAEVQAEVEAIAKTNSQTVTADTYKGILKSIKSTTRTDKAKQEGENVQRKRFWKAWNKANREGKQDLKTKRKNLNDQIKTYAKGKKGTITAAQTRAVVNRVNSVNLDNELSVQELIDYSEKIFNNADFAVKEAQAIKLNSDVTKKLNSGAYGLNTDLNTRLSNILNTPISSLTSENVDSYNDFLKRIKNSKKSELAPFILEAQNLFDSLYVATPEVSEEVETKEAESLKNIVDKIIDEDVDGETLLKDNSKFIENDLGKLDSFELETLIDKINLAETDENTDIVQAANNYAENRQKVLNNIKSRSKGITLKNLDTTTREAGDVNVYKNIKDSDIVGLTGNQLMELEVTLENINEGFYTHAANKLGQSINSRAQDIMPMIMKYGTGKHKAFMAKTYGTGFVKSKIYGRGVAEEMIRSNPLSVIDNVFGNYANENIRNNTFTPIGSKYAAYNAWAAKATDKLAAVEKLLAPSLKESVNKSVERNFEVQMYLLALESESNLGVKGIDTPNGYVSAVVKKYNKNPQKSRYNESDIAVLEAMLKKYNDNGVVTTKKMDESLSPKVKKAIKIMRDVYNSLSDKQAYATTIVRGGKLDLLNNYVHHKMDVDTKGFSENRDQNDSQLQSQMNYFNSSTKSKTSISRTGVSNNKSIDFSPVSSALRAVRAVGMDYYLTNEIQTERKALNELIKITERNTDRKEVIQAAKDLNEVYTEAIDNVIGSNFSTDVVGGKLMDVAKRIGYYGTLASVPRAAAELGSNLTFALLDSPLATMDGMTKYGKLGLGQNGLNFAINVGAISYTKLYNSEILSGSKAEQGGVVRNKKTSSRTKQTKLGEGIEYAGRFTSQGAKGIEFVADNLLSTPDKMISRPLFFGTFGRTFKSITGQEMDVNKISENDQEYMEKYADAIKESRIAADKAVTQAATSNDPFSGVLKNQLKAGAGGKNIGLNYYRTINSYMARFTINEYATARQAVASMVGQGDQSPIQGAAKLTAVMARMSLYVVAYKGLTALWQAMLGLDDEDDVDYEELAVRQAVGAGVSLITRGVSGNIPMMLPNYYIEMLNEDYGEELGLWSDEDGEGYNQYKHSLIFSLVNSESVERKGAAAALVNVMSGPLSNQVNASLRVVELLAKMDSKNPTVANRAYEEFVSERTFIEMVNIPGAMPFYKDVRRYYVAKNWSEVKEAKRLEENKGKPLSIKQMELINPRKAAKMRRKKKELKEKRNNDPRYQANLRAKEKREEKRDRELRRRRR